MAKGWESKSVEDQIADVEERKLVATTPKWSRGEIEKRERAMTLQLSRSQLLEQLERARSDAHKQMLQSALTEIEAQLAA